MIRRTLFPLVLGALATALMAGCDPPAKADAGGEPPAGGKAKQGGEPLTVGVVFDSGGRDDKSFNDSAYQGVERAEKELGITARTVETKKDSDYPTNLGGIAEGGAQVVFAVGFTQGEALKEIAPKHPEVKFAIVDGQVDGPNVRALQFAEEQGSFLAGVAAALATKTGKVGFVGGKEIPLIKKFEVGYAAGARYANPQVKVLPAKYTDSWEDVNRGKAAAALLYADGADVVYHAAGRCGLGVFAAVREANSGGTVSKYAIGVDLDQDDQVPGQVLTSMVKRVDEAVFSTIQDVKNGQFTPGVKRYDLASNGVGLTDFRHTKNVIGEEGLAKIEAARKRIVAGEIKVPTTKEELDSFLASPPSP